MKREHSSPLKGEVASRSDDGGVSVQPYKPQFISALITKKLIPTMPSLLHVLNLRVQVGAFPNNRKLPLKGGTFLKEGVSGSLG